MELSSYNNYSNNDLIPELKTCIDKGQPFIKNQSEGDLWIVPNVVRIHYKTDESYFVVSLFILNIEVDRKEIKINNPVVKIEGYTEIAKASFELIIDIVGEKLLAKGTVCLHDLFKGSWSCLPDRTWTLLHW